MATQPTTSNSYGATTVEAPPIFDDKPPPTYQEVTDPNAPPPSYDALYGEYRQVDSPKGFAKFIRKVIWLLTGGIGVIILTLTVSSAMVIIGSVNVKKCPAEPYIPIYLIVGGIFGLLKSSTDLYVWYKSYRAGIDSPSLTESSLNLFITVWFIAGTVWVYRTPVPEFQGEKSPYYCDRVTYYFTLGMISALYILLGLAVTLICCGGCFALCGRSNNNNSRNSDFVIFN